MGKLLGMREGLKKESFKLLQFNYAILPVISRLDLLGYRRIITHYGQIRRGPN